MNRKPHPLYDGYEIGDDGSVWSRRRIGHGGGIGDILRQKKPVTDKRTGYQRVQISVSVGVKRSFYVHRLVLETFVGLCPDGMQACHNDGNGSNNALSNLRWDTQKNNHNDKKRHGTSGKGSKNAMAILTEGEVSKIKSRLLTGERATDIWADYPAVTVATIFMIKRELQWAHVEPRLTEAVKRRRKHNWDTINKSEAA